MLLKLQQLANQYNIKELTHYFPLPKDVGYRPVFSGGELRDLGIQPKSTGKGILYTWNANGSLRSVLGVDGIRYSFKYDALVEG